MGHKFNSLQCVSNLLYTSVNENYKVFGLPHIPPKLQELIFIKAWVKQKQPRLIPIHITKAKLLYILSHFYKTSNYKQTIKIH